MLLLIGMLVALGALIPSLAWLFLFLREDIHPEPKRLIIYVFSLGALSTIPALLIQMGLQTAFKIFLTALPAVLILAFIEEFFKFLAAYLGVRKNPAYDEPIDAMIYMVTAALGFATIENLFVLGNVFNTATAASLAAALNVLLLRFVGATLLHVLASALLGFHWARGKIKTGILTATLIHAIFNYFIIVLPQNNLLYASLLLIVAAFFVFQDFEKLKIT